jgi:hypothetical protein
MVASLAGGPLTWASMARRPALLVATPRADCTALGRGLSARLWAAVLCGTGPSRAAPPPHLAVHIAGGHRPGGPHPNPPSPGEP